jgi:hypothetical protein
MGFSQQTLYEPLFILSELPVYQDLQRNSSGFLHREYKLGESSREESIL